MSPGLQTLLRKIAETAATCRAYQKAYFADRTQAHLIAAKVVEKELDELLAMWSAYEPQQAPAPGPESAPGGVCGPG